MGVPGRSDAPPRSRPADRIGGAWLGFTPMLFAGSFTAILTGWGLYALFAVAVGGLADAFAVARVRAGAVYGRIRLWGSVGYVVAAVAVGAVLSLRGRAAGLVPIAMWITLACVFFAATRLRGEGDPPRARAPPTCSRCSASRSCACCWRAAMHWICLTPYNVYFGVFLRDIGLPPVSWSFAYSTGVVVEVLVLMTFHRLSARFRLPTRWRRRSRSARRAGWRSAWCARRGRSSRCRRCTE